MGTFSKDIVQTQSALRYFYQPKGACPGNVVKYGGQDGEYIVIEDVSNPKPGIDTINVHDPNRPGGYQRVARSRSAPDYPTANVKFLQRRGYVPEQLITLRNVATTYYEVAGMTKDLSDFTSGWDEYVKIFSYGEVTDPTEGGGSWDSGDQVEDDYDYTFISVYTIGPIGFSEKASTQVYSEAIDVCYGLPGLGNEAIYAVINNTVASPGEGPAVIYRTEENGDWTTLAITGAVSTDVPKAIRVVNQYLVVVFDDGSTGGYFYAEINSKTQVPGAFTKMTTGFVAAKAPLDVYVADARSIYFSGEGGYLYKSSNVTAGVTVLDAGNVTTNDLNRIDGTSTGVIVAVGESDTIVYSEDRGNSWTSATATGGGNGLDAVSVVNDDVWWVGDDSGAEYYTTNQGSTWTAGGNLPSTIATVQDIVFVTDEVGFILCATSAPAGVIYTTYNGGNDWTSGGSRIISTPTADRFNRLAYANKPIPEIQANYVSIAGLAGDGSDGLLLVGEPKML